MIHGNQQTSAIGWVDFSSEHRERVKSVIDLLSTPGVIDELGIGVIRDSFSDSLFPGISTIQTRAKYFLTVPRLFKDYDTIVGGDIKRRRGETFYVGDLRVWMSSIANQAINHVASLRPTHV